MKSSLSKSFRYEIIIYCLLSIMFTLLTIGAAIVLTLTIYASLGGKITMSHTADYTQHAVEEEQSKTAPQNSPNLNNFNYYNYTQKNGLRSQGYPFDAIDKNNIQMVVIFILFIVVFAVILFIYYFLRLTKKFSNFMQDINEGIDEISHGNFAYRIKIEREDEFGVVADKINKMAKDIQGIMESDQRVEDKKHELITAVAHDLRTPLTSVIGYLELLRSNKVESSTKEYYLEIVYNKAKRLEQLIEDLFSYTKYTYGSVADIKDAVDVVKLIEQLIEEFYPSFEENRLEYEFYKDCCSLVSYADGNLLARALANLIGNAIKYGVEGKRIEISLKHTESEIEIEIKNYGLVIPKEKLPHIFERFYRVEDSRSQETGGSGLGLAIAKSIILMHHGEITANSSLNGTVFEVRLPIIRESEKKQNGGSVSS